MGFGAALALGGASLVGGLLGNQAAAKESRRNRRFQESMSSTAYQRGVKDLEAAGLNRVLAAGGSMASTPSGSAAAQQNPMDGAAEAFSGSAKAFMQKKRLTQELSNMKAQEKNLKANTNKALQEAKVAKEEIKNRKAQTRSNSAMATKAEAQAIPYQNKKSTGWTDYIMDKLGSIFSVGIKK